MNKTVSFTLFKTLLTSLANSLEHTSKWKIFPQFETQAPRSCEHVSRNASLYTTRRLWKENDLWEHLEARDIGNITPPSTLSLDFVLLTVRACIATWGSLWFTRLMIERRHSFGLEKHCIHPKNKKKAKRTKLTEQFCLHIRFCFLFFLRR